MARAGDSDAAEARVLFQEGVALADAGQHEAARLKFQGASALTSSPTLLYNLARAEQLTGHDTEGLTHFRLFLSLETTDPRITVAIRENAKAQIVDLLAKVGQVEIEVSPEARVSIDGKPLKEPPREPVAIMPGKHIVEATLGNQAKREEVIGKEGRISHIKLDFSVRDASAPRDSTSLSPSPVSAAPWVVPTILGGAGLVGIGLGIGYGLSALSTNRELRSENPRVCANTQSQECIAYEVKVDDSKSDVRISYAGYIAGAALLAGAAITAIVLWPKAKPRASANRAILRSFTAEGLRPIVGSETLGAAFEGRF